MDKKLMKSSHHSFRAGIFITLSCLPKIITSHFFPANHLNAFPRKWGKGVGAKTAFPTRKKSGLGILEQFVSLVNSGTLSLNVFYFYVYLFTFHSVYFPSQSVTHWFPHATFTRGWRHVRGCFSWCTVVHWLSGFWSWGWAQWPHRIRGGADQSALAQGAGLAPTWSCPAQSEDPDHWGASEPTPPSQGLCGQPGGIWPLGTCCFLL